MPAEHRQELTVAIGGFGAIGHKVARTLDAGIAGLRLVAVSARNTARAEAAMGDFAQPVPVLPLDGLPEVADIVVECVPAKMLVTIAEPALKAGRILIVISVGALLSSDHLIAMASRHGGRIIVPTGALIGLDAVTAAAEGTIHSVRMITRKPAHGLAGAPYLVRQGIDLDGLREPRLVFKGTAREAARGFPANLNVAAALGLAGLGPDHTMLEIWADPGVSRNIHTIEVKSDSADFTMTIQNIPSEENPKTGKITPLSIIAALRKLNAPLRLGT